MACLCNGCAFHFTTTRTKCMRDIVLIVVGTDKPIPCRNAPSLYRNFRHCRAGSGCGWRWTYCGVTYTAEDYTPGDYLFAWEKRTTLWVDPRDPSRLLPSTWGLRLFSYLIFGGVSAFRILCHWGVVP